ncbi:MAG: nitrous oxide reductase accessory protein NosL [Acidobacteriota bacterium]
MRRTLVLLALTVGCAAGPPPPAALDTANEACRHCRMMVSDVHFAAQIVAPGDEALFFDDVGCLREYLETQAVPPDAVAYVADHRTGEWVRAADAVYTRATNLQTPMGSGLVAHRDEASRSADAGLDGVTVARGEVFASPPPGGSP